MMHMSFSGVFTPPLTIFEDTGCDRSERHRHLRDPVSVAVTDSYFLGTR